MGWMERVRQWEDLPEKCRRTGVVLLLRRSDDRLPNVIVSVDLELKKRAQHALDSGLILSYEGGIYAPVCLFGTTHHLRWKAENADVEHTRLCEEHAREEGWLW